MATANPLVCTPNPVPSGATGEIDITFVLTPGTPDKTTEVRLTSNGTVVGSGSFTLNGTPAEATPAVTVGQTGSGWELQASTGTLVALGANKFTLRY